ncbi:hypothetical protein A2276_01510 [candidate division WOR-1 bacterium RIFOXYA12_FULL_43_27]|uniref:PorV/PorQ family protein n=1 Tax=candidate division WOR-1 bacterium RIFOXYC2_FULL_46_14 TaxID=1802587 RepID=A0A1F4U8N8_UNCSA|nr:MAG: hypothetical protein A2276_01510 [candidate division WOR-1 bacterium RIFOXYA12_FULL_43_27]OGC19597.1 MAG: hypothetical protein A2292_02820 [candidate division WOR-1 bacterium RIFOXYB2_FULL_46_45]OGC30586.1 MAG: hypothetical protein A2232_02820 [candidate division WOR-1 bacterium RIFOXYA2_FULL_46_56]OGC40653.1 MAG: hypothetical protein A2438_06535 [candidate division WOR-1 bacterium RIFOXYC2_FULL_46_14]
MKIKYLLVFLFLPVLALPAFARAAGTTSADFLNISVGARAVAMGEAYTALARGPEAVYWNPAGLVDQKLVELSSMHANWFGDMSFDYLGFAFPYRIGTIGLGYTVLNYGSIPGYDSSGAKGSDIGAYDGAFTLSWAQRLNKRFSLGVSAKYINEKLDSFNSSTIAADCGILFELRPAVNLALVAKNQIGKLKFISEEASVPSAITIGISAGPFLTDALNVSADYTLATGGENFLNYGLEYYFNDFFCIRGGSSKSRLQGGLGFKSPYFNLDYAYVPYENLGATHRVSFGLRFGINKQEEAKLHYNKGKELYRKKKYLDALNEFRLAIETDPSSDESREFVSRIVSDLRQEEQQNKLKSILEQKKKVQDLLDQATAAYQEGDYNKALELVDKSLQIIPGNQAALKFKERLDKFIKLPKGR